MGIHLQSMAIEMAYGSFSIMIGLMKVLIPLMIVVEILMVYNVIERLATKMEWLAKLLGISKNAIFPLLVGILMGVTYGAGTIIEINKRMPLSKKDMAVSAIFMYLCHAIIEAGFLFYVAGANVLIITIGRILIALAATLIISRLPMFKKIIS